MRLPHIQRVGRREFSQQLRVCNRVSHSSAGDESFRHLSTFASTSSTFVPSLCPSLSGINCLRAVPSEWNLAVDVPRIG